MLLYNMESTGFEYRISTNLRDPSLRAHIMVRK